MFPLSRLSELRTPFRWDAAIEWSSGDLTYQDFVPLASAHALLKDNAPIPPDLDPSCITQNKSLGPPMRGVDPGCQAKSSCRGRWSPAAPECAELK